VKRHGFNEEVYEVFEAKTNGRISAFGLLSHPSFN
jgi:hypothetical protein